MSYSELYIIDKDTNLSSTIEYSNSWLFAPMVWEIILNSYIQNDIRTSYGIPKTLISSEGEQLFTLANNKVNNSTNMADRVVWELSQQQIMYVKDKVFIADSILKFLDDHINDTMLYNRDNNLQMEHIAGRFKTIANDIKNIDDNEKYFILKNTSVDDSVEVYFSQYDEELDDSVPRSLRDASKNHRMELVQFSNDYKTMNFLGTSNPEFKL